MCSEVLSDNNLLVSMCSPPPLQSVLVLFVHLPAYDAGIIVLAYYSCCMYVDAVFTVM